MRYAKKSLGQNYLIDLNIIKKIVNLKNIKNRNIIEIGPGKGALTDQILKNKPKSLTLIEKDNFLFKNLRLRYKEYQNISIYNEDVLKFDFEKRLKKESIIFGNLPYNISSQIIVLFIKLRKWPPNYSDLIFMFQREMADRIIGNFGTNKYGRLSILRNYRLKILNKFNVSCNCFFPKPKVDSTILHFKPNKKNKYEIIDLDNLEKITNLLFSGKRKMINKNMRKIFTNKQITSIGNLNLKARPSDLKPDKYYEITKFFEKI